MKQSMYGKLNANNYGIAVTPSSAVNSSITLDFTLWTY